MENLVSIELAYVNTKHPDFTDANIINTLFRDVEESNQRKSRDRDMTRVHSANALPAVADVKENEGGSTRSPKHRVGFLPGSHHTTAYLNPSPLSSPCLTVSYVSSTKTAVKHATNNHTGECIQPDLLIKRNHCFLLCQL